MIIDKVKNLINQLNKKPTIKNKHMVALDVGTEYVKALICKVGGGEAEIIGVGRAHQQLSSMQAGAVADISAVVEACDQALTKAEQQAGVDVRDVVMGIAGELVKGGNTTVAYKRSQPKSPLTIEEIEGIVLKAQGLAYEQARKELAVESGNQHIEVRLVNSALVSIEIDGYPVTNPVGFQGGNVAVQLYTAFAPMIHIGALERIAQELDLNLVALSAEPFAVARSVVGNDVAANFSAVLIDIGGGTTDIAVLDDSGVQGTEMFGIGGRAFTRTIASELSIDFEEAEKTKLKFSDSKLPLEQSEKVLSAVEKTLEVWLSGVQLALEEFKGLERLPDSVLLCGGGASLNQIVSILSDSDWHKDLPFNKKPSVHYIAPSQVVGMIDKTGDIKDHTLVTAMGLIRVGLDSTDEQKTETWRDKINKALTV